MNYLKTNALYILLVFALFQHSANAQSGEYFIKKMQERYVGKWHANVVLSQETEVYTNDTIIRKETWQEALRFPHELRIDYGKLSEGNSIIYQKDSTYRFKRGQLQSVSIDKNSFVLFSGGIYFLPNDSLISILKSRNYDLSKTTTTQWQGRKTFIIGTNSLNDSISNQFWIDAENLYVVRKLTISPNNNLIDVQLSGQIRLNEAWMETEIKILKNGKLVQKERYNDIKVNTPLAEGMFLSKPYLYNTWGPVFIN